MKELKPYICIENQYNQKSKNLVGSAYRCNCIGSLTYYQTNDLSPA